MQSFQPSVDYRCLKFVTCIFIKDSGQNLQYNFHCIVIIIIVIIIIIIIITIIISTIIIIIIIIIITITIINIIIAYKYCVQNLKIRNN